MGAGLGAALVGGFISLYSSSRSRSSQARAQEQQYQRQYENERRMAMENAQARMDAVNIEAESMLKSANAHANASIQAAMADAGAILAGASAESDAAKKAASAAYHEAMDNVALHEKEAAETLRQLENQQTQYEEKAKARAAASGGTYSGSTKGHVDTMEGEHEKVYTNLDDAFKSQQDVARSNAKKGLGAAYAYADAIMTAGRSTASATSAAARAMAAAARQAGALQANSMREIARRNQRRVQDYYRNNPNPYNRPPTHFLGGNNGGYNYPGLPGGSGGGADSGV